VGGSGCVPGRNGRLQHLSAAQSSWLQSSTPLLCAHPQEKMGEMGEMDAHQQARSLKKPTLPAAYSVHPPTDDGAPAECEPQSLHHHLDPLCPSVHSPPLAC